MMLFTAFILVLVFLLSLLLEVRSGFVKVFPKFLFEDYWNKIV